jgi:hypothetical protein
MPPLRLLCKELLLSYPSWENLALLIAIWYFRLEQAAADPETLSQNAIIDNLNPEEAARLSKVRNIGIAVSNHSAITLGPHHPPKHPSNSIFFVGTH